MAFSQTIDQNVWANLMEKTPSGQQAKTKVLNKKKFKNFEKNGHYKNADGNLVRAKFKAPIRDAVKDLIGFWQHKEGRLDCRALDNSISKGNQLLALSTENRDSFNQKVEGAWSSPVKRDAKITNQRGKYAAQMLAQYTDELQRKSDSGCQVSGDKELDYVQQDLDTAYEGLGASQGSPTGGGYGGAYSPAQAGIGGNGIIFLALGAVAFAVLMFVKAKQPAQPMAVAPAPTSPAV